MAKQKKRLNERQVTPAEALIVLDGSIAETLAPYAETHAMRAIGWIGKQGDQPQMISLSGLVLAAGLFRGDKRVIAAGGRMLAAHLLATVTKHVIKRRIDRHRPPRTEKKQANAAPRVGRRDDKVWTSFPSGHTAGAVAVAQGFARVYPEHRGKALAGAAIVSLAQVCKQAHYLTDVTAGIAIGWASEALVHRVWPRRVAT